MGQARCRVRDAEGNLVWPDACPGQTPQMTRHHGATAGQRAFEGTWDLLSRTAARITDLEVAPVRWARAASQEGLYLRVTSHNKLHHFRQRAD